PTTCPHGYGGGAGRLANPPGTRGCSRRARRTATVGRSGRRRGGSREGGRTAGGRAGTRRAARAWEAGPIGPRDFRWEFPRPWSVRNASGQGRDASRTGRHASRAGRLKRTGRLIRTGRWGIHFGGPELELIRIGTPVAVRSIRSRIGLFCCRRDGLLTGANTLYGFTAV